jgi:transporter family-2 protein
MSLSPSLSGFLLIAVALAAGVFVPFQAASNAALGRALGHPLWATVASLLVSLLLVLPIIFAMKIAVPKLGSALQAPPWAWFGGLAGVFFITAALLLAPRLGTTGFIVCVIAGQMIAALLIDHFGLLGLPAREVNMGRAAGVLVIFAGVIIVQYFTRATG